MAIRKSNTEIDSKVLNEISFGNTTFSRIQGALRLSNRELDNSLRRLKARGQIFFNKAMGVWALVTPVASGRTPSTPVASRDSNVTHFGIVIDMSGSMNGLDQEVSKVMEQNMETVRQAASAYGQRATVSLFSFRSSGYYGTNARFTKHYYGLDGSANLPHVQFQPGGGTPLYDAISSGIDELEALGSKEDSRVLLVITDGDENTSKLSEAQIRNKINVTNRVDTWTFAAFCPPRGERKLTKLGFAPGNVQAWDRNTVQQELNVRSTMSSTKFMAARSTGMKSNKTDYFVPDLSNLTRADLNRNLTDLQHRFKVATVPKEVDVRDFITQKTGVFIPGTVFVQLTKAEKLSSQKEILIKEKGTRAIYGGADARKLIGLPESGSWKDVKIKPGNHANYDIFLQSTSQNRKLVRGSEVIYMP